MVDEEDKFNVKDLYKEGVDIPRNLTDPVLVASEAGWPDIDWEEIDEPEEIEDALATLGTQLHYINLAQVLLLGETMSGKTDIDAKRLAILIAETRMRDVDAWGRYLSTVGKTGDLAPKIEDYFERLHDDDEIVSCIIGFILPDVFITNAYRNLDSKDVMLYRLIERNVGQAERNVSLSQHYLDLWIEDLDADERRTIAADVERYITLQEQFIQEYSDVFRTVNIDPDQVLADFRNEADELYNHLRPHN